MSLIVNGVLGLFENLSLELLTFNQQSTKVILKHENIEIL